MASVCGRARQALQSSSSVSATRNALSKLCGSNSSSFSRASKLPGFTSSSNPRSFQKLFTSTRIPVELVCAVSLMPLHSATASALFNSLLSLHAQSWGCLSEGFATPL